MSDIERVNEIERLIAEGKLNAAQVFTQMRQLVPAASAQESVPHANLEVMGNVQIDEGFKLQTYHRALVTVTIKGQPYVIVDIGLRMLTPRELYNAQGFPPSYIIDHGHDGRKFSKSTQVLFVGNSVSPPPMTALCRSIHGADALAQPKVAGGVE